MDKERRKFKRFDAFMNVKLRSQEASARHVPGLSKDLSREGMKVNSRESLRNGTLLNLEIDIPDDPKPVYTTGKIMWSRESAEAGKTFDHGISFLLMDPVDKFRVLDYAYNHWLETKVNDYSDPEELSELA
jgi:c-di-GMP-binding flagellar brake protein YcgR